VILPDTTKSLDQETVKSLSEVTGDGSVFVFDKRTPLLNDLQPRDVLVIGVTDQTPYGALRKVKDIREVNGQVVVETSQATLADAITQGVIEFDIALSHNNLADATLKEGVHLAGASLDDPALSLQFDHVSLYPGVEVSGYASLQAKIHFRVELGAPWEYFRLKEVSFIVGAEETARLEVQVSSEEFRSFSKEVEVGRLYSKPFVIWVKIPIVVVPILILKVGGDGMVSAGAKALVQQEASFEAGLHYKPDWGWTLIKDFSVEFPNFEVDLPPQNASFKGYVKPEFDLLLYGVTGAYASAQGFLELSANTERTPWWELFGGLLAGAGVKADIIGIEIANYEIPNILRHRELLDEAEPLQPIDLIVRSVEAPFSAKVGDTIPVTFTVENQGDQLAEFTYSISLSTDPQDLGTPLGDFTLSLEPRSETTETVEVTIPEVPSRDYFLTVFADSLEEIDEGPNEDNNMGRILIFIESRPFPSQSTASTVVFTNADGVPVDSYTVGDRVYILVEDMDENRQAEVADKIEGAVVVENVRTGQRVLVDLTETGADEGIFWGMLALATGPPGETGALIVEPGDTLRVTYTDPDDPEDISYDNVIVAQASKVPEQAVSKAHKKLFINPVTPPSSTVLVMDVSGSMQDQDITGKTKIEAAKDAARKFVDMFAHENEKMGANHQLAIVTFSSSASIELQLTNDANQARRIIDRISAGGGTNMAQGLSLANDVLMKADSKSKKIIILLSDGVPTVSASGESGSPEELKREVLLGPVAEAALSGHCIYVVGFGIPGKGQKSESSIDQTFLATLALASGCGQYYTAVSADQLSNIYVQLRHQSLGQILKQYDGQVRQGEIINIGKVSVPPNQKELHTTVSWSGSKLEVILTDPKGSKVNDNYPGAAVAVYPNLVYVIVLNPLPGDWHVEVFGSDVPEGVLDFHAIVSVRGNERSDGLELIVRLLLLLLAFLVTTLITE